MLIYQQKIECFEVKKGNIQRFLHDVSLLAISVFLGGQEEDLRNNHDVRLHFKADIHLFGLQITLKIHSVLLKLRKSPTTHENKILFMVGIFF